MTPVSTAKMDVWRICRRKYEGVAFTGEGAEKAGGRWNFTGHSVVYTSENLSLAALELFVHISPDLIPGDLVSIRGTLPDSTSAIELKEADLPANWREYPAPPKLQEIGTHWLQQRSSALLIVPSAINPVERNILLNPSHAEVKRLKVEKGRAFKFDPRMFGKSK